MMGSFHTNCHDISLQLMRRFLHTHECGIHSWPLQFKDELSPLIQRYSNSKGSLLQLTLERFVKDNGDEMAQPIPPLIKSSLEQHIRLSVAASITCQSEEIEILPFYHKSGAIKIGGILLGSAKGR